MTEDPLRAVLKLVADGHLTADEAAPILDSLAAEPSTRPQATPREAHPGAGQPRFARIEVREGGRKSVNLRVPLSVGRRALSAIPGLSATDAAGLGDAITRGLSGPIVDIEDADGDGVRIVLE